MKIYFSFAFSVCYIIPLGSLRYNCRPLCYRLFCSLVRLFLWVNCGLCAMCFLVSSKSCNIFQHQAIFSIKYQCSTSVLSWFNGTGNRKSRTSLPSPIYRADQQGQSWSGTGFIPSLLHSIDLLLQVGPYHSFTVMILTWKLLCVKKRKSMLVPLIQLLSASQLHSQTVFFVLVAPFWCQKCFGMT